MSNTYDFGDIIIDLDKMVESFEINATATKKKTKQETKEVFRSINFSQETYIKKHDHRTNRGANRTPAQKMGDSKRSHTKRVNHLRSLATDGRISWEDFRNYLKYHGTVEEKTIIKENTSYPRETRQVVVSFKQNGKTLYTKKIVL